MTLQIFLLYLNGMINVGYKEIIEVQQHVGALQMLMDGWCFGVLV